MYAYSSDFRKSDKRLLTYMSILALFNPARFACLGMNTKYLCGYFCSLADNACGSVARRCDDMTAITHGEGNKTYK